MHRRLVVTLSRTVDARDYLVAGETASNRTGRKLLSDRLPDARGLQIVVLDREHIRFCARHLGYVVDGVGPRLWRKSGLEGDPTVTRMVNPVLLLSPSSLKVELGFATSLTIAAAPKRRLGSRLRCAIEG